ncbi:hypothetical protein [Haloglycomyces albus]|uniref:hypothetical protein n=1 Tax=Haloglycomyces albus TaxID=526067 RepID=UPI00046D1A5F|nr:hypothetical protein [Haloglycomyces albus]
MTNDKLPKTVPGGKSRVVQTGHLEVGEITSPHIGASAPFGDDVTVPMPVEDLNWEYAQPVDTRVDD